MRNIVFPRPAVLVVVVWPGWAGVSWWPGRPLSPALRQAAPTSTPQCQLTQASSGDQCASDQ